MSNTHLSNEQFEEISQKFESLTSTVNMSSEGTDLFAGYFWIKRNFSEPKNAPPIVNIYDQYVGYNDFSAEDKQLKFKILSIIELYKILDFFMSIDIFLRSDYIYMESVRRSFLTTGALITMDPPFQKGGGIDQRYIGRSDDGAMDEDKYVELIAKIDTYINWRKKGGKKPKTTYDFWGGCGMVIPEEVQILLDAEVVFSKLQVLERMDDGRVGQHVFLTEKPSTLVISSAGQLDVFRLEGKEANEVDQLISEDEVKKANGFVRSTDNCFRNGFSTLSISNHTYGAMKTNISTPQVIDLAVLTNYGSNNGRKIELVLVLPFPVLRNDVLTKTRIIDANNNKASTVLGTCCTC